MIVLEFRNDYCKNGRGLHFFEDQVDKETYVYTQFEPYYANRAFPCFDQPNIKALFKLRMILPLKWCGISNELVGVFSREVYLSLLKYNAPLEIMDIMKHIPVQYTEFKETKLISTYLFVIIAGPYVYSEYETEDKDLPKMRIYYRKSKTEFVPNFVEPMFKITVDGFKYYQKLFDYPYPYSKYDQIFVPEFVAGAMENPGAITFNECYIPKELSTPLKTARFSTTILHEMSHNWFGNLVTMNWWNDLWLNESFATIISYQATADLVGDVSWFLFLSYKTSALRSDQMPNNHPVLATIENTEEAESNFDSITYGKGASSLKQLMHLISPECFYEGIRSYFKKYAYSNTVYADFIGEMKLAVEKHGNKINLDEWSNQWLMSKGASSLTPEVVFENGVIKSLKVIQEFCPNSDECYRVHKIDIALYQEDMKEELLENVMINACKETIITEAVGRKAMAILLNANDYTYGKPLLDKQSLSVFTKQAYQIKNLTNKEMISKSFYQFIRDGKIRATEYIEFILGIVKVETNEKFLSNLVEMAEITLSSFLKVQSAKEYNDKLFNALIEKIINDSSNKELFKELVGVCILSATTQEQMQAIIKWAKDKFITYHGKEYKELEIKELYQIKIIKIVYADLTISNEEKKQLFELLFKDSNSESVKNTKIICDAMIPDKENKEKLWNYYLSPDHKESFEQISYSMSGFYVWNQIEMMEEYVDKFINAAPVICKIYSPEDMVTVLCSLCPLICNAKVFY